MIPEKLREIEKKFKLITEDPSLYCPSEELENLVTYIKEKGFYYLSFITAIHLETGFEVVYHFRSLEDRGDLLFKVKTQGEVPTISHIFRGANWMEREVYDLFGIQFKGHPDLRRIVLPEDWEGHPLRKDYPMDTPHPPYR